MMVDENERIAEIMRELGLDHFWVKTSLGDDGKLYDELRIHIRGDAPNITSTANEWETPIFAVLKELETLVMGETS